MAVTIYCCFPTWFKPYFIFQLFLHVLIVLPIRILNYRLTLTLLFDDFFVRFFPPENLSVVKPSGFLIFT